MITTQNENHLYPLYFINFDGENTIKNVCIRMSIKNTRIPIKYEVVSAYINYLKTDAIEYIVTRQLLM